LFSAVLIVMIMLGPQSGTGENCDRTERNNTSILRETLGRLNLENPEMDVHKNIDNNELRFICVCGFTCYTPGVEQKSARINKAVWNKMFRGYQ
jgi:hypothetical protein